MERKVVVFSPLFSPCLDRVRAVLKLVEAAHGKWSESTESIDNALFEEASIELLPKWDVPSTRIVVARTRSFS